MSLLDDRSVIILENGFIRTRDKSGKLLKPSFDTKTSYPIPNKSDETDNSPDNSKTRGLGAYWYW